MLAKFKRGPSMPLTRRGLITGLIALVAAPAIVRVTSITRSFMPGQTRN
jgi:hypothetical protein